MEIPALCLPVPTHVLLYDTYCCTSTAVYVLGERGAWRGVERKKPPYRTRSSIVRYTLPCLWHSSAFFLLLYSCRTINIIVHTLWVRGFLGAYFSAACCAVLLLYYVLLYVLLLYGVGGWVDRFVGVHGFVFFFLFSFLPPAIPAPSWHSSAYH